MLRQAVRRLPSLRCCNIVPSTATYQLRANVSRPLIWRNISVTPGTNSSGSRLFSSAASDAVAEVESAPAEVATRMRFADLSSIGVHANLVRSINEGFGYEEMTEVQERTVRAALQGKDMVAQAKTGTGKTLAFLLPMLQRMIDEDPRLAVRTVGYRARSDDIRGIVLSPTRELAEQITAEAKRLVRGTGLIVQSAVGGQNKRRMLQDLQRRGCHLLVATPGRLCDLLSDPSAGVEAPNLAALVLDEADRMLDVGFEKELREIQQNLPDPRVKQRQTLLFSATIPPNVVELARNMVRRDQFVFVQTIRPDEAPTHEKVPQKIVIANGWTNLFPAVYELLDREIAAAEGNPDAMPFKAIVYLPTTVMVTLATQLDSAIRKRRREEFTGPRVYRIHGKLDQRERTQASDAFRRAESAILFSSDVTARGMDFPDVSHVIQVGSPPDTEQYIHRLGRTGRQDKPGQGWVIIPKVEVQDARRKLAGINITPDTSLKCAKTEVEGGEVLPPYFEEVSRAFSRLNRDMLSEAYTGFFGQARRSRAEDLVEDLNQWSKLGWGWEQPPSVSQRWLDQRGLRNVHGFNVGMPERKAGIFAGRGQRDRPFGNRSGDSFRDAFGRARGASRSEHSSSRRATF